ncbi:hypothetical protein HBH98_046730 [Parastagonospora nodorum]|nr:hypothetical protein HBI09_106530 [Parastagonospora nodorum]KAH4057501.1 hypothetical protein HBH49_047070 [Parastagonospora nodorum]KAH4169179.1 hypothetical protein HBH43_114020 [Parastagonospora nodorum]KAH4350252.1 hypothetical protein HBH98_046730 [Parastagonospora nodorum]KAH4380369.1 hypothetical protein HBH97_095130 [Parastagonospora nodorum]
MSFSGSRSSIRHAQAPAERDIPQFILSSPLSSNVLIPKSVDRDPEDVEYPGHILEPGWIRLSIAYRLSSAVISLGFEERQAVNIPQQQDISGDRQSGERLKDKPHGAILWVDALCINQADDSESTTQAQMMRLIYERCQCVIVYLGDRLDGKARGHEPPRVLHFEPGEPPPPLLIRIAKTWRHIEFSVSCKSWVRQSTWMR